MGEVQLKGSGDFAQLQRAFEQQSAAVDKLEAKLKKLSGETKNASKAEAQLAREAKRVYDETRTPQEKHMANLSRIREMEKRGLINQETARRAIGQSSSEQSGFNGLLREGLGTIGKMAAGIGSVASVTRLLAKEYQAVLDKQKRAAAASMSVADAEAEALRNLGATTPAERDRFTEKIKKMSATTGVSRKDLYGRASTALSARGDLSVATAMDAVEQSAMLIPEDAGKGTAAAGAALDLAKITGSRDAKKNLGLLMGIGQTARVTDIGLLAENVAPALTGVTARGGTAQEAGAIWSALTGGMADPTGRMSATAAIGLAEQLAEALPEKDAYGWKEGKGGGEERVLTAKATGLTSTLERIKYLQQNPEARERFMATASFEKKARAPIEQIVSGEGATAAAMADALARIPTIDQAGALYDKRLQIMRSSELQTTARFARGVKSDIENLQTADQMSARLGAIRDAFAMILKDSGLNATQAQVAELPSMLPEDLRSFAKTIKGRAAKLNVEAMKSAALGMQDKQLVELRRARVLETLGARLDDAMPGREVIDSRIQGEFGFRPSDARSIDLRGSGNVDREFFQELEAATKEQTGVLRKIEGAIERGNKSRVPVGAGAGMFTEPKG